MSRVSRDRVRDRDGSIGGHLRDKRSVIGLAAVMPRPIICSR